MRRAVVQLGLLVGLMATPAAMADEAAVRAELKAIDAPWYDAQLDTWRRVEVQLPKPPPQDVDLSAAQPLVTAAAWLIAAGVLLALAWLIWQVLPKDARAALPETKAPQRNSQTEATLAQLVDGETGDPETALAAARRAADWPRAVVWLYAILLLRLDQAGAVRVRRGATNRRYRLEVHEWTVQGEAARARHPDLLPTVDATIAIFEQVYFGQQPADRALVDGLEARIRASLAVLPAEVAR
jgi:hypothetical protein